VSLFLQHGYGKGDKLDRALEKGLVKGVILSPRDEDPERLKETIATIRGYSRGVKILFDPQCYAFTLSPVRDGKLAAYPYYRRGLSRADFVGRRAVAKIAAQVIDYQATIDIDGCVTPTVHLNDLRDVWSQIALELIDASIDRVTGVKPRPLYASLLLSERAMGQRSDVEAFLDVLTRMEIDGVYVILARDSSSYTSRIDPAVLENYLYMVYVLGVINEMEVHCGFADTCAVLLHAAGAASCATGWHNGLRQFSLSRFRPATGGRQPRPRYTSSRLLNSILLADLDQAFRRGVVNEVLSGTDYDLAFRRRPALELEDTWDLTTSTLHHLSVLGDLIAGIEGLSRRKAISATVALIDEALGRYAVAQAAGVEFDPSADDEHLRQWKHAIKGFRDATGL
jgi:hypothetical protein